MKSVDLRSDTITLPTKNMRKAMYEAELGDDVFGEDPTVNRLEKIAAEVMGKEAALFVASGTMGNIASQLAHCGRGDEIILGDQAHVFFYEQGGTAAVGGIHSRTVPNLPDGKIDLALAEAAVRSEDIHFPRTRLLLLENTHNRCNGNPLDLAYMDSVAELVRRHDLRLHIDGARIFNAAVALGTPAKDLVAHADSVTFCLSKGLCAPAGSVVCGDREFILRARRARKVLGGGMRQAGILAAAGILAITEMVERLAEDHANATNLAAGMAAIKGISVNPDMVHTNIVFFSVDENRMPAADLVEKLSKEGVRMLALGPSMIRAVTHHPITAADIEYTLSTLSRCMGQQKAVAV